MKTYILFLTLLLTFGLTAQVDTVHLKSKQEIFRSLNIELDNYDYAHSKINQDLRDILKHRSRYHFTKTVGYALLATAVVSTVMSVVSLTGAFDHFFPESKHSSWLYSPTAAAVGSFSSIGLVSGILSVIPLRVVAPVQRRVLDERIIRFREEYASELQVTSLDDQP